MRNFKDCNNNNISFVIDEPVEEYRGDKISCSEVSVDLGRL